MTYLATVFLGVLGVLFGVRGTGVGVGALILELLYFFGATSLEGDFKFLFSGTLKTNVKSLNQ